VAGMAGFAALRLGSLVGASDLAWLLVPMLLTYAAAATIGLVLLGDGENRWWWVPACLFVLADRPFEAWVGSTSVISANFGVLAGSATDAALILAPGILRATRSTASPEPLGDERILPSLAVFVVSLLLAMLVGINGPDASTAAALAIFAFGICSRSRSWMRAVTFVAIAACLGAALPASAALALAQGQLGWAGRDATVDLAIALLSYSIAPLSYAVHLVRVRHALSA
jgi:hypothetical protein